MADRIFTGKGQSGNWSDPHNWMAAPTDTPLDLVTQNATMNGTFTTLQLMFLGHETVTVNGTINTLSPGVCASFMVCGGATAIFSATSNLNSAGGLIVGNLSSANMIVNGTATQHPLLNVASVKIGRLQGGLGDLQLNNAVLNDSGDMYVGQYGSGSLEINGGSVSVSTGFVLGRAPGTSGSVTLSNGAHLAIGSDAKVGGGDPMTTDPSNGAGHLTVGAGCSVTIAGALGVSTSNSSVVLSGGSVSVANAAYGATIWSTASLSGFGTLTSAGAINNQGVILASGGNLVLNGALNSPGQIQIGAGATLTLHSAAIGSAHIAFVGSNGTLALDQGVANHAVLSGFVAGDTITMAGVDQIGFNSSTDLLTLSGGGHVVDTLTVSGTYAATDFTLTHSSAGAVIGVLGTHH